MQNKEQLKATFIKKAEAKFGKKFDYSKLVYIDCKTPGVIICPEHGEFVVSPEKHLRLKNGCPHCDRWKRSKEEEMTFDEFVEKATQKYNHKFSYKCDNWLGLVKSRVILVCPEHGEIEINPRSHIGNLTKFGCPECGKIERAKSKTKTYDKVLEEFKTLYDDFYLYPEENRETYINKKSKIKIICPKHGEFVKTVQKHLSGQGCHKCKLKHLIETNQLPGGYCEDLFFDKPELKEVPALLYYFSINNGKFFKIGITKKSNSKSRVKALIQKAKSFGITITIQELYTKTYTLYEAFQVEQKILKDFHNERIYTKWSTELFKKNIEKDILKYF